MACWGECGGKGRQSLEVERRMRPTRVVVFRPFRDSVARMLKAEEQGFDVAPNFYPIATGVGRMPSWAVLVTVRGAEPSTERSAADRLVAA